MPGKGGSRIHIPHPERPCAVTSPPAAHSRLTAGSARVTRGWDRGPLPVRETPPLSQPWQFKRKLQHPGGRQAARYERQPLANPHWTCMDMTWATLADKLASTPLGSRIGGYDTVSRFFSAPGLCQLCYQTGTSAARWRQHPLKRRALCRWL